MKTKKQYNYVLRSFRIVDGEEYAQFRKLCEENFSTPQREFNLFVHRAVKAGTLGGA